jgi:acetyl-CoA C-acetyltransferase
MADAGLDARSMSEVDALLLTDCMTWRYDDPALRLAERLNAPASFRYIGRPSGTTGQVLVNLAADRIRRGETDVALVCGGEALASLKAYRKLGKVPAWSYAHPDGPEFAFDLEEQQHPGEVAIGLTEGVGAVYNFAMRDVARRAHLGVSPSEYRRQLGETQAGMTSVAAANPFAWFPDARSADFLIEPRPDNRLVAYPYTKHMVAMLEVDISAALLLCSQKWADEHGIASDKRVYPWTSCYAEDPVYLAVREKLWCSPGMAAAGEATLGAAGIAMKDVKYVDLYSCFPSAVNFARDALGIADRPGDRVTVTGGLPYAGGPGSSYMLTSIVQMIARLRADPEEIGLVSGVGMMMSNHVFGTYSAIPPGPHVHQPDQPAVQAQVDREPACEIDDGYSGQARIAAYTVMYDREGGASHGAAICDLPSGARSHARITDLDLLALFEREEMVGRTVNIAAGGHVGSIVCVH